MTDETWTRLAEANREERRAAREFTRKLHGSRRRGYKVKSTEKEAGCVNTQPNGSHVESTIVLTAEQLLSQPCSIDADAIAEALSSQPTCDFAAVIRAVEPDVAIVTRYSVFGCYRLSNGKYHWTRTLAEAQKIAAAIAACLPGAVIADETSGPCHWVRVKSPAYEALDSKEFTIDYTPEVTP
jgi:hypothetical protein